MAETLKATAEAYWNQGLSIVLMTVLQDGKKDALHTWKQWETQRQTRQEFDGLPWLNAERFAVVCGVQGINGLYFTPIDTDNPDFDPNLLRVTQTERTPRGGHHFIYWSRVNARGKKRHDLDIELLGKGNLCLMWPSKDYVKVNDNLPTEIDDIKEVFEGLAEKLGGHAKPRLENNRVRFCCREALARDSHIDHLMRLAIASEYKRAGYSNEDIVQLFKSQDDYNHDKCLVQVESADPSKTARQETIKEYGYCYPECQENCIETKRTQPKTSNKTRKKLKDSGILTEGCYETIYDNGKPLFLKLNGGTFSLVETIEVNEETFSPKERQNIPYEAYGCIEDPIPSLGELARLIRSEFETWVDVEPIWKDVLTACVLLTYQQEKLQTVPYLFLYGDNESGKTTVMQVLQNLCYRPMFGITIPSADLYGYLEDSDGQGCILEDEIQGIQEDTDKLKIYKAGYKQGAVVPRTLMTAFDRIIKYYRTFCFKACAGEQISPMKGFNERFLFIAMVEGLPPKEWADLSREDKTRMQNLRNMLLKWRMMTRGSELPDVELSVKGRLKELWKPILQITSGLPLYNGLYNFVDEQRKARLRGRQDTLEGKIVKVVIDLYNEAEVQIESLPFKRIWLELVSELNGKLNENKPNEMDTSDFFTVTKNRIGYRLREILSGETKVTREKDSEGNWISTKAYLFNHEKLRRVAKKYGYELVTKLPSLLSSEGV
ncbi:hypothetical protein MUO83_04045 [Candidatus Bathyarchaeota archaeon]|nr:hypothetical protein [Candidatus Bathyarchaeota archaeon]